MKKLLNTLYVLTPESYLFCRNENICIKLGGEEKLAVPALTIDAIVCFGQMTVSTPLLAFCGEHGISITFLTQSGAFQGRFYGPVSGNVLLRKKHVVICIRVERRVKVDQINAFILNIALQNLKIIPIIQSVHSQSPVWYRLVEIILVVSLVLP